MIGGTELPERRAISRMNIAKLVHFNVTAWLGSRSQLVRTSITVGSFAAVVAVLYYMPSDVHISALFLIPISFGVWFISPATGWLASIVAIPGSSM